MNTKHKLTARQNKELKKILKNFDYKRVKNALVGMNYVWDSGKPNVEEIKERIEYCIKEVCKEENYERADEINNYLKRYTINTGYFHAERLISMDKKDEYFIITFTPCHIDTSDW